MDENHEQHNIDTEQAILKNVEKYGCHLALVEPENDLPGFVFSIGLYKNYAHPEIICFGLNINMMGDLINDAKELIKKGRVFTENQRYSEFMKNYDVQFIEVDKAFYPDYLGYASWFYDSTFNFPVLQLVWPDKEHRFPWDKGVNANWKFEQPLLDRNIDFHFNEERSVCVFTTKQAFEGDPILYVYHDEDGDWQFHTSLAPQITDSKLASMEEITKLDPSINKLYHLQPGWSAWRESINDKWHYEEYHNEEDAE